MSKLIIKDLTITIKVKYLEFVETPGGIKMPTQQDIEQLFEDKNIKVSFDEDKTKQNS